MKDGFYQCSLDDASQKYCCFSTPFGCFKFLRLPFGLTSAPEKFQELTSKHFIMIAGSTKEEHDATLKKVLKEARENNIKFNPKKVQFMKRKVEFLGFVFGSEGVEPDKDRITSVLELKKPNDRKELQSFLSMINYLRGFIPNLSDLVTPFRVLLKKDISWEWGLIQQKSFAQLKEIFCSLPMLSNFNLKDTFEIQTDASERAIGCCIFQNNKPIHYASRCLSENEINYAQVEKEMVAIVFACTKFHYLIYGQDSIKVNTDHQPSVSIMKKEIHKIPNNRLRRLRLKLLLYNVDVQFLPGKYMYVADY